MKQNIADNAYANRTELIGKAVAADFNQDEPPPEGAVIQALLEDGSGPYALPFPVVFREETGCINQATGEEIAVPAIGWRLWTNRG